jgi:hypothetical protein
MEPAREKSLAQKVHFVLLASVVLKRKWRRAKKIFIWEMGIRQAPGNSPGLLEKKG